MQHLSYWVIHNSSRDFFVVGEGVDFIKEESFFKLGFGEIKQP
jgi:hypothetical protein